MDLATPKQAGLPVALLSAAAAASAVSLMLVSHDGPFASRYALVWTAILGAGTLLALICARPLASFGLAVVFLTSPLSLMFSLQQSALVSAFLLGGAGFGLGLRGGLRRTTADPLSVPVALFAGYAVVSALQGMWAGNDGPYVFGDCFQIVEFALVYLLATQLLAGESRSRLILRCLLGSILTTILVELLLFCLGPVAGGWLPSWEAATGAESLVRTIDVDATFLFAVLISLYPIAGGHSRRFLVWAVLIPTVANLALSLSRGLWLCSLIAVFVLMLLQPAGARRQLFKAFVWVSVGVVVLAAGWKVGSDSDASLLGVFEERIFHGVDQIEEGMDGTESLATRRFLEMAIVWPQVLANPWVGHGLGATYVIGGFAILDSRTTAQSDHHFIHNLYLVTAFRMGLLGLSLFLWILFRYFRGVLRGHRKMPSGVNQAIVAGLIASIVGQLFLSITQPTLLDHPTCVLVACAMAVSMRLATVSPDSAGPREATFGL